MCRVLQLSVMKPFQDASYHSSIRQFMSKSRVIGMATLIALILLYAFIYESARLPTLRISNQPSEPTQQPLEPPALKAAVIIEGRNSANLIPLILHFSSVLGPEWPIKVLHTTQNGKQFSFSPAFRRQVSSGHIMLRQLPSYVSWTSRAAVSEFFTQPSLYHSLAPYKHLLFFQGDSILCANSRRRVEDFLQYDFVGAPINPLKGHGMNGGLSLRNREKMLEVLDRHNFTGDPEDGSRHEDQWFIYKLEGLPRGPNDESGAHLPSPEVALEFSAETSWTRHPFGLHQVSRWQPSHVKELDNWCPEYRLAEIEPISS